VEENYSYEDFFDTGDTVAQDKTVATTDTQEMPTDTAGEQMSPSEFFDTPEDVKATYEGKIDSSTKSNIDKMYDMNSQAIDKSLEANPEMKYIAEAKKAENELKRKQEYDKAYKEQKAVERLDEAKATGEAEKVDVGSRVKATADEMIFGIWENLYAPALDKLGESEAANKLRAKAEEAKKTLAEVNSLYKDIHSEDAINIAGGVTELVPNIAGGLAAGGKTLAEAGVEAGITYAKTGDVKEAATVGLIDLVGGKIADTVFSQVPKKWFSDDIEALPYDEKKRVKDGLNAMVDAGVDKLDETGRRELLKEINFTKPKEEISKEIRDRLTVMRDAKQMEVDDAYKAADEIAKQSKDTPVKISEINQMLNEKNILKDKKVGNAVKEIQSAIKAARTASGKTDLNAFEIESIISTLKANQRGAEGKGVAAYGEAIDYFTNKQKELVGDIYEKPRELSKEFKTRFKGTIDQKGVDTGKVISTSLKKEKTYGEARNLVGENFDANKVDDLLDYKIPQDVRTDMVKDVLLGDTPLEDIDTKDAVVGVLSRWNNADKTGLKKMLGKEYGKVSKQMYALELIQNTMSVASEDKKVLKSVADFALNASMLKISPLFAYKGMVHEGKNIATAIAFKKTATNVKSNIKNIKDRKVQNALMRGVNIILASTIADKAFEDNNTVNQYGDRKLRMED